MGHIGSTAATFAAQRIRSDLDEIDGAVGFHQIVGDADRETSLAVLGHADNDDDARSDLLLAVIDQRAQIFWVQALHGAGEQLHFADGSDSGRGRTGVTVRGGAARPGQSRLTLGIGQLFFHELAFVEQGFDALDNVLGLDTQCQ